MSITRKRVILRAQYGWPRKTVPFDQHQFHQPDGYRMNAAGFVSMCWDIPLTSSSSAGGPNIVTLLTDGHAYEIPLLDLRPGDAIGYLGPDAIDTDGGTIVLFDRWLQFEQKLAATWDHLPVVGLGPDQRAWNVDFRLHAYRYRDIVDDEDPVTLPVQS